MHFLWSSYPCNQQKALSQAGLTIHSGRRRLAARPNSGVIPEEVRRRLGLKPGIRFIVVGKKDVVILKAIQLPDLEEFDALIAEARKQARRGGLRQSDVKRAVMRARRAG